MAKPALKKIKECLMKQLEKKNGKSDIFTALAEDYCNFESLERKLWAAMNKLEIDDKDFEILEKRVENANNRKMNILKQLEIKPSTLVCGDDEEM